MSTPSLHEIRTAIVAALEVSHTVGVSPSTYAVDLTDRVQRGRYTVPPTIPFAAVSSTVGRSRRSDVVTSWTTSATIDVVAWVAARSVALDSRVVEAEDLLDALLRALQTAATTIGNALRSVPDIAFDAIAVDSDLEGAAEGCVQVAIAVSFTLNRSSAGLH